MDIKRTVLWVIFALSVVMLFDNWQRANGHSSLFFPTPEVSTPAATGGNKAPANDLPQAAAGDTAAAGNAPGNAPAAATAQKVRITTDVYEADISTQGGTLSFLALT